MIICRDQPTPLQLLLTWLEKAGQDRIYLIDNDSSYPLMREFLESTQYEVIYTRANAGQRAPWLHATHLMSEHYIVSDPDIVPTDECPLDAIDRFKFVLDNSSFDKVGFSLKIDDLPDGYAHKNDVMAWESQFWIAIEGNLQVYRASLDTTFALYRPGGQYSIANAARTMPPYTARHLPWYIDSSNPTDEQKYYREHANKQISHWSQEDIPMAIKRG